MGRGAVIMMRLAGHDCAWGSLAGFRFACFVAVYHQYGWENGRGMAK